MTGTRIRHCVASAWLPLLAVASMSVAGERLDPDVALNGIREGLEQSREDYVAAVVEVVDAPKSQDPGIAASNMNHIKTVEVLSSRGGPYENGAVLTWFGGGVVGQRYLVFLVPAKSWHGVYGASFMSQGAGHADRRAFVHALKSAGL